MVNWFHSGKATPAEAALEELLDLCEDDDELKWLMQTHGADRTVLREQYQKLCAGGAAQWTAGHFVAASALAYGPTLIYVLENRKVVERQGVLRVASRLIRYFQSGESGLVT